MGLRTLIRWKYHEIIWINNIAYMGGEYPKGGGAIFLGYSSPGGGIPRNIAPFWEGANLLGGDKSPVTTAWANSSTFLKILSCPPKIWVCPSNAPPNSEAWRRHWFALKNYFLESYKRGIDRFELLLWSVNCIICIYEYIYNPKTVYIFQFLLICNSLSSF
jgi:hypothetical protein